MWVVVKSQPVYASVAGLARQLAGSADADLDAVKQTALDVSGSLVPPKNMTDGNRLRRRAVNTRIIHVKDDGVQRLTFAPELRR